MEENQLIANVNKIRHIPSVIIQGRYDLVCPIDTAWKVRRLWLRRWLDLSESVTSIGVPYIFCSRGCSYTKHGQRLK